MRWAACPLGAETKEAEEAGTARREDADDLDPRDRSLLQAVFLEERDRDEVCREFGVDRDYLRVMLHRAKQEFKSEYVKRIGNPMPLGANI